MPHVSQMIKSNYLKASDLLGTDGDYDEAEVTIRRVGEEELPGNDDTEKWVVHFDEYDKGLILNVTNTRKIAQLCGDLSEDWIGKRVRLYVAPVSFRGEEVPAIRIKAPRKSTTANDVQGQAAEIPI
jgi:hypothetical protein